jgi:hypothetical protein
MTERDLPRAFEGLEAGLFETQEDVDNFHEWASTVETEARAEAFYLGFEDYWNVPNPAAEILADTARAEEALNMMFGGSR